jgi:hypothetical protein
MGLSAATAISASATTASHITKQCPQGFHQHRRPFLPLLLLARRLVESAFHDAVRTRDGRPTEEARLAREWLESDLDWTRKGVVPPPELRRQYPGSFQWCCRWLSLDPQEVREHGLPQTTCADRSMSEHWQRTRGMQCVYAVWREAGRLPAPSGIPEGANATLL